ncbi:MAG: undecaprenyl-phosphate glucose phosphotransferase [Geminicoccaceae bacterium]|nr:undecaprenyl-phosphate glucose phosphotransferase [Geminicoccaceae bacterium]
MQLILDQQTGPSSRKPPRRTDWLAPSVVAGLVRVLDALTIAGSGLLADALLFDSGAIPVHALYSIVIAIVVGINLFQIADCYDFRYLSNLYQQSRRLVVAWPLVLVILLTLGFISDTLDDVSRAWVGLWLAFGLGGLFAVRVAVQAQIGAWHRAGRLTRNVVVIGAGEHGRRFVEHLRHGEQSVNLIGLFDDRRERVPDYVAGYPVLGTVDDLLIFARHHRIDQVVVALPWGAEARLLGWMKKLRNLPVEVRLCPDMIGFHLPHSGVSHIGGVPLLNVFEKPLAGWDWIVKAVEDRLLAGIILLAISPLMLIIAFGIKLTSPGPVFFKQKRYGFNNEVIEVYKFRSMYQGSAQGGLGVVQQATRGDPRITPIGGFLRRTSLDELPQFLNVFKGDMSIVGPRPHAVAHNEQYARLIDEYLARHKVKPGITGWAQVHGLRGETDTLEKMERRVQYDLYYIENWSFFLDMKIILTTFLVGFMHPNAY